MISILGQATLGALLTISLTIFIAELTDKDALLLLTLATRVRPRIVFAAGSVAFTITTAIIITAGYFLVNVFPVFWIKIASGLIMIGYGIWGFKSEKDEKLEYQKRRLFARSSQNHMWQVFLSTVLMLAVLDLAGDATELLIIVFVAQYQNVLLVFVASLAALMAATALETIIGHKLRTILSLERIRLLSLVVFLILGATVIMTTVLLS